MIKHMARVVDPKLGPHQLAYGNFLTIVFQAFNVPLGEGRATKKDMIDRNTLAECDCLPIANPAPALGLRVVGTVT